MKAVRQRGEMMNDYMTLDEIRKALEAAGWTPPRQRKEKPDITPTVDDIGALCEFGMHPSRYTSVGILTNVDEDGYDPFEDDNVYWEYARLITKTPIRFLPWHGGECPVPDDTPTLICFRDWTVFAERRPQKSRWKHNQKYNDIIGYMPLEFIGLDKLPKGENNE